MAVFSWMGFSTGSLGVAMPLISKREAARRQLDAAIRLHFADDDPVVVHSLASSAANLYSDLVEQTTPNPSWRKRFTNGGEHHESEVKAILNQAWNFFKHADRDPAESLDFDPTQTELMLFYATLECGELEPTTEIMQLFQLWLLRTGRFELELTEEIGAVASLLFPDLSQLKREVQLERGRERLAVLEASNDDA